jgi:hypothetical protein
MNMRARATDASAAALGFLMHDLKQPGSSYRFLHYNQRGDEATIQRSDGARFIVRVREVISD